MYKMREGWRMWLPVYLTGLCVDGANITTIFAMEWSTMSFGPDGPWQAVQIQIGSQNSVVSLYPGGVFSSHILAPEVCNNSSLGPICYAEVAGLYNYELSSTSVFGNVSYQPLADYSDGALQMGGDPPTIGTDVWNIGSGMPTLSGMDMAVHTSIWGTLLDGTTYPLSVGSLALGAPGTVNQTFSYGGDRPSFNATLLPGWLWAEAPLDAMLSSNSFGLHIGSVSPSIAPSLYFGGFDQNRVLGTVSTQQGIPDKDGAIDLLDISLSVASGASPWTFDNLAGLLASGNSSIESKLSVAINSLAPYLHLPKSTCDAIAAHLPVTYQAKYGLYFWNTGDPQYEKIVSSTSFLSFNFRASESANNNLTINVPFKLLNLTLTAPLTSTPTMYFPCKAETQARYQLGRAFLQAAFVGANWNAYEGHAAWWLAQAPGPNIPSQTSVLVIGNTDTTITGSTDSWTSTWKGFWTPLPQANSTGPPLSSPNQNSSGLSTGAIQNSSDRSTGAKVGIGIGVSVGAIVALISGFLLWSRQRKFPTYYSRKFMAEVDASETARIELPS
jgi:hypothetical protein